MRGVDLSGMLLALYKIDRRSKKYYNRIIYYLLGVCIVNAWIIYKINTGEKIGLLEFTIDVALSLMYAGKQLQDKVTSGYSRQKVCKRVTCQSLLIQDNDVS